MKGMLELLRSFPSRVYGFLFTLIILSALLGFFLAQSGSIFGTGMILAILIIANLLVILI
jgi:hypothetical protein